MKKFISRKLFVVGIAFIIGIVLACFGILNSVVSNFIISITGLYLGGNTMLGAARAFGKNGYSDYKGQ